MGAGGAGVMVSMLTLVFDLPIHTAVGTALAAMVFTTISGSISHFREGNVVVKPGVLLGLGGMIGAIAGADLSQSIPEHILQPAAGAALLFLAFLVWLRMRLSSRIISLQEGDPVEISRKQVMVGGSAGFLGGVASAFFGVGMAPFVQLTLLTVLR
ncbi:MAG: sulfite exporter TauE/SafE family protein, partial [Thermomicrobiales bacterium]|nr:sulfite exporter TauE/SafE family protein [Thermomicrobiales bacterium]